jgi:hypothetical protein
MIINISRMKAARTCWHKAFNNYHRDLEGARSMNLVDGGAMHEGIAHGMATKDWDAALTLADDKFAVEAAGATIPPEQTYLIDQHRALVRKMVETYRDNYTDADYDVLQPECIFDVTLPESWHSCIWRHWWDLEEGCEVWGAPDPDKVLRGSVADPHEFLEHLLDQREGCACWTPHRFVGKTDNIIAWKHNIWLQEHKSTALAGPQFWDQWLLDIQPTGYMYGVWRATNVRPSGFILNAIIKPSEAQVASYNKRRKFGEDKAVVDYVTFERQAFLRSEEDLSRFEHQAVNLCNEWEDRIKKGYFDMSPTPGACLAYNRRCDFFAACLAHDEPREMSALGPRKHDYVNDKYEYVQITQGDKI